MLSQSKLTEIIFQEITIYQAGDMASQ